MKKYILSLVTLLFTAAALVSCDDDFDDIKVNYPQAFPTAGIWASEFTNNDNSEYIAVLNTRGEEPSFTVYMLGRDDDPDVAGSYNVVFYGTEMSYDPEVGQFLVNGTSAWGEARVFMSFMSDQNKLSMHLEVYEAKYDEWTAYCISTLHPTNNMPLYGFQLEGIGGVDDETGEEDTKYYRFVLNDPSRSQVGYCYIAASSKPKDIRQAEIVDFYYNKSGNTYKLLTPDGEEMVLSLNDNYQPVVKLRGKTVVLDFSSHTLTEKEFKL